MAFQAYEPQTKYDLRGKCDPVGPDATEELHLRGRRRSPVQQQESDQAWNFGGQEKAAEQDEVEGKQLCYHIVRHGQHKHLDHVGEADQGAQGGRARDDQQQSGCDHGAAGEDFISRGRADGVVENPVGGERAERLHQPGQWGINHLHQENFHHTVANHLFGKREANEKPKPLMQPSVILPAAVEKWPDDGRGSGNH